MSKILYKDSVKGHEFFIAQTSYKAIFAVVESISWFGGGESCFLDGFVDLDHAKQEVNKYIDDNIALNQKLRRAHVAYEAVMRA